MLKHPDSFYSSLVESARDVITLLDENGVITFQNPAITTIFGYNREELIGVNVFELLHPDDTEVALSQLADVQLGIRSDESLIVRFRNKQGDWRFVEVMGQRLEGELKSIILITRDVTEKQLMLLALQKSEQSFHAAFNATSAISAITVPETGEFRDVNDAWVKMLGWSREEAIGKTAVELGIWGDAEARAKIFADLKAEGRLRQYKTHLFTRSGERKIVLVDSDYLHLNDSTLTFVSGIDITERELIEEQLRQSQKLESIGQLTGGIAHDFNNLLSVIMGHAELASLGNASGEQIQESIDAIARSAQSGAKLIEQLLAFSRKQKLNPEAFVLSEDLARMAPLLQTTLGKDIQLSIIPNDNNWLCFLDPTQFESAILNMVINSRDAMPDGGKLELNVTTLCIVPEFARSLKMPPGDYVSLEISDTGKGISADVIAHVFDPFFTTKQTSGGSGLGLSMVFGFTKQSGGHVSIAHRSQGSGTTITLLIPRTDVQASEQVIANNEPVQIQANKRVLLVEDNEDVRLLISKLLASLKFEVFEAESFHDVDRQFAQDFDLLVSDVMLPGDIKGPEIAQKLRLRLPNLAVLYMSGFQQGVLSPEELGRSRVAFIPKPFTRKDFSAAIHDILQT